MSGEETAGSILPFSSRSVHHPYQVGEGMGDLAQEEAVYEKLCGICFTEVNPTVNPQGKLNSCDHLFCFYCISQWAKHNNACPSCKSRFSRIVTIPSPGAPEVTTKVRVRNFHYWEEDTEESEEFPLDSLVCSICKGCENMVNIISCDRRDCTFMAHLACLHLKERPLTFICETCSFIAPSQIPGIPPTPPPTSAAPVPPAAAAPKKMPVSAFPPLAARLPHLPRGNGTSFHSATPPTRSDTHDPAAVTARRSVATSGDDDSLYFLRPSEHAVEAQRQLAQWRTTHEKPAPPAAARDSTKYVAPSYMRALTVPRRSGGRGRGTAAAQAREEEARALRRRMLEEEEATLTNPARRRQMVEKMAGEWAADMVDVIRQRRYVQKSRLRLTLDGGIDFSKRPSELTPEEEEAHIWKEATDLCRPMVEQKLQERLFQLKQAKETALRIKSQREAAALAKIARITTGYAMVPAPPPGGAPGPVPGTVNALEGVPCMKKRFFFKINSNNIYNMVLMHAQNAAVHKIR
eukprot:gene8746-6151_t